MSLRSSSPPDGSLDTLCLSSTRIKLICGNFVRWERMLSPETGDEHRPLHHRALSLGLNPLPPQALHYPFSLSNHPSPVPSRFNVFTCAPLRLYLFVSHFPSFDSAPPHQIRYLCYHEHDRSVSYRRKSTTILTQRPAVGTRSH